MAGIIHSFIHLFSFSKLLVDLLTWARITVRVEGSAGNKKLVSCLTTYSCQCIHKQITSKFYHEMERPQQKTGSFGVAIREDLAEKRTVK